uniref:Uncharacterized protein n=1 Tax=Setaria italica TaxID=4555 RepID=K3ZKZ4_SETIT
MYMGKIENFKSTQMNLVCIHVGMDEKVHELSRNARSDDISSSSIGQIALS